MAVLHAKGELGLNEDFPHEGILGTIFTGADLAGAQLDSATYDEKTVLPDGTFWTAGTDMTRFTDPDHPAFWRSDDPASPAYVRSR